MAENLLFNRNAHLATCDRLGPNHEKSLELARLHSIAVDYAKTGVAAEFPSVLKPKEWPDFMPGHFGRVRSNLVLFESYSVDCILSRVQIELRIMVAVGNYVGPLGLVVDYGCWLGLHLGPCYIG